MAKASLNKKKFSFFANTTNSKMTLGAFDDSLLAAGDESQGYGWHTFNVVGKNTWTLEMQDARYFYMTFLKSGATKARISTADEFIYIPDDDFTALKQAW